VQDQGIFQLLLLLLLLLLLVTSLLALQVRVKLEETRSWFC